MEPKVKVLIADKPLNGEVLDVKLPQLAAFHTTVARPVQPVNDEASTEVTELGTVTLVIGVQL